MRLTKTVLKEVHTDVCKFFGLINLKVVLCIVLGVLWFVEIAYFADWLYNDTSINNQDASVLISIFSNLGIGALIFWTYHLVGRAKRRIEHENKQILNALGRESNERKRTY